MQFYGCYKANRGMYWYEIDATEDGINSCFAECRGRGHMYAGFGCSSGKSEKIKCFCLSVQSGMDPLVQQSAPGGCNEGTSESCPLSSVAGYEIAGDVGVAFYGLLPTEDYVVNASYEPVAILRTQPTGAASWSELVKKSTCVAPSGSGVAPPAAGNFTIPAGSTYVVNGSMTINGALVIESGATLSFAAGVAGLNLTIQQLDVYGTLQMGTEGCPLQSAGVTITLVGSKLEETDKGIIVRAGGVLDIHGKPYTPTWSRLRTTAEVGSSTIALQDAVDWEVGQQIVVVTTRHGDMDASDHENEVRTITGVDSDVIHLDRPLDFFHYGGEEYQGEVGLLSRSITIQGDEQSEDEAYGGHVVCLHGATCRISYALGYRMGQKNVVGRYPFHLHLMGDVQHESYFRGVAVFHSYFRAFTIHGTSNATLSTCVAYDVTGSAVYMEDGWEMDNDIEYNLVAHVYAVKPFPYPHREYDDNDNEELGADQWLYPEPDRVMPSDLTPGCFYCTNQHNNWVGNAASGGFAGFIFPATPYVVGASMQEAPPGFEPVKQELLEFDSNTAHSSGQYWKQGGCIYIGGMLLSPDANNHSHHLYNYAKFPVKTSTITYPDIHRGRMNMTNTKLWGCGSGLLAWGVKLEIRPLMTVDRFEVHDSNMGIQFFAHNILANALFTAQTQNTHVFKAYTPSTAFKTYDMFMQTLFTNVTVRGYKGPQDVAFMFLVNDDYSAQEAFTGFSGIRFLDTEPHHMLQLQRGDYCEDLAREAQDQTGSATTLVNTMDTDGSLTGFSGGGIMGAADCPQYDDTKYRTKNWWWLDESCKVTYGWLPDVVGAGDKVGSGFVSCPRASPKAWAAQLRAAVEVRVRPYRPGVVYHWGHEDRKAELVYRDNEPFDYGHMGPCCDIGWYMQLDDGAPAEMTLKIPQMVFEGGLLFATPYPAGAQLTIERCRGSRPFVCEDVVAAANKQEFLADTTGLKFFVDSEGVLFLRLLDPLNVWFEYGASRVLKNMPDDSPYYGITSDMAGQVGMHLPPEDWMA